MSEDQGGQERVAPLGVQSLRVFYIGVGILLALAVSLALMVGFYSWKTPVRSFSPPRAFPAPSVLQNQGTEREELFAQQRRRLADAAIPIEEAMALIVARGASAYSPAPQPQSKTQQTVAAPETPAAQPAGRKDRREKRRSGRHRRFR